MGGEELEIFEVGPCEDAYTVGYLIGQRFSSKIKSRLARDLILQDRLLPFAQTPESQPLIKSLTENHRTKFPRYWDELVGIAEGSDDCSDVLVASDSMAIVAHNEDANVALVGHTGTLRNGLSFIAYTNAGELPSCAFGLNSHGLAFTLNSVPPLESEIVAGGIGRNFISRDLLEAKSIDDALCRIESAKVSAGHSYNLIETRTRRIINVETASKNRVSVYVVGETPFFHANMYLHLQVNQVHDENSLTRQRKATTLPKGSKEDVLSLLGDTDEPIYPIYMTGPTLYTLCTAVIDLDEQTLSILEGNPKKGEISHIFSTRHKDFKMPLQKLKV
ncbi:hypothetical protein ACLB2K_051433 [Fragaria x ananassa]